MVDDGYGGGQFKHRVEDAFLQFPSLPGRQLEHLFPAFTQAHLHLQHCPFCSLLRRSLRLIS